MAESEGFEPSIGLTLYTLSKRARSTTLPRLRIAIQNHKWFETLTAPLPLVRETLFRKSLMMVRVPR